MAKTTGMRFKSADLPTDPAEMKQLLTDTLAEVKSLKQEKNSLRNLEKNLLSDTNMTKVKS